ncbi:TetR/AcrR family transcriptional regulator [Poseidonibacter antarcticus]|uniref:TetR/AcrR family transcriptional regulator n=1 Tax=Poseidonibacter antarcticus TaxID=2478538 RepID=UPI000EF534A6|nr:TetR/AcrR family transcriptional regulator [Poseidonibacter antarcticus]
MSKRKNNIIETSISLFNKKGYMNTSTRHIAQSMNISVGNLYYYFKNKEDILIEIFNHFIDEILYEVKKINFQEDTMFLFENLLINNYQIERKYAFLTIEINTIIMSNPNFRKIRQESLFLEIDLFKKLIKHQIKFGYFIKLAEEEINFLISNVWTIAVNSYTFWSLLDKNIEENLKNSIRNIYYFLKPYFTQKRLALKEPIKSQEELEFKLDDISALH